MISSKRKITVKEQQEIFRVCEKQKIPLSEELEKRGLSYDDLVYTVDTSPSLTTDGGGDFIDLSNLPKKSNGIPAVSFFSGAGGLDIGFEKAGFDGVVSIEINELFCETLRKNFPSKTVLGPPTEIGDLRKKEALAQVLRQKLNITTEFEGVFHGGPPCQPFSIAANQRFSKNGDNFKRVGFQHEEYGNLLFDYVWIIKELRPKAFLIENVPGLKDVDEGEQLALAVEMLKEVGYQVNEPTVLNAAEYGVPQNRNRVFVIGHRTEREFSFPEPSLNKVPCFKALQKPVLGVSNHETREHKVGSVKRYVELAFGKRDQLGRVDRLDPNMPSKTVIAGGAKGGGRSHLHPWIPRTLSVRECARLQTFPDDYEFVGSSARQFTQVGNAVPPYLAYQLASKIFEDIFATRIDNPNLSTLKPESVKA